VNDEVKPGFDVSVPHIARVYDYWLGGKDNFAADREAGDLLLESYPKIAFSVRANRAFLARAVRYLVTEAGITQFVDIGTGLPTANNTHEVAQSLRPECRVMYVDNDPMVLSHAKALLTSDPQGATAYLDADLRDTGKIVDTARNTLDFTRPVAVMLIAVLHCIPDSDDPHSIVTRLIDAVPPGSFLVLTHSAKDIDAEARAAGTQRLNQVMATPVTLRGRAEVTRFFDGLELLEPGVVRVSQWRPGSEVEASLPTALWGGVAEKRIESRSR
jgi:hypothetical protein